MIDERLHLLPPKRSSTGCFHRLIKLDDPISVPGHAKPFRYRCSRCHKYLKVHSGNLARSRNCHVCRDGRCFLCGLEAMMVVRDHSR